MLEKGIITRKLIHFFTGIALFLLTYVVDKNILLWIIVGGSLFAFVTYPFGQFHFLHKTAHKSYGTLFYPLGILSAYLVLYPLEFDFFRASLLLLTISDTLANLTGQIKKNIYFSVSREKKSMLGTIAFVLSAVFILYFLIPGAFQNLPLLVLLLVLFLNFEIISFRGSDNLTIPLGSALVFRFAGFELHGQVIYLTVLLFILSAGCYLLFRFRLLTRSGSLAAYLTGVYLFGIIGINWGLPVLFFFFTSVFFTKIHNTVKGKKAASSPRNSWQVLANILPALVVSFSYLITKTELFIPLYISLIAAVTADTWASEMGPVFSKKCFSLAELRLRPAGISGGISWAGSFAALMASFSASVFSWTIFYGEWSSITILMLTFSGFLASFIDSLLGAFWEPKLLKNHLFEKGPLKNETLTPNDLVNLLGSATAPLFFLIMQRFLI